MADDKTAIANIALLSLGETMIASIDDSSVQAGKVKAIFEQVVKELLSDDWHFCRARVQLNQTTAPTFGTWEYAYTLPADLLNIRGLGDPDVDWPRINYPYQREGQYIYTNQSEAYLYYNRWLSDPNTGESNVSLMPVWFHRLISARIAHILAPNTTENMKIRSKVEMEFKDAHLHAKERNGEEAYFDDKESGTDWADGAYNEMTGL